MQGGGMTLFPEGQQVTVPTLLSPFQPINNQFNLNLTNPTVAEGSLASNQPVNNFNIPPESADITANTNNMNIAENFSDFSNRLLDLDTQQAVELNSDFSLSLLGSASLLNMLNNNADGDIEENMSDSLRNMSLDKQWREWWTQRK